MDLMERGNDEDVSETELKTIKVQLRDKQKKMDKLDDEVLQLVSESENAEYV